LRVLITGGSGKIGTRLIERLEKSNYQTVNFDVRPPKSGKYEFIEGSILDREAVQKATKNVDVVIHLAAYPMEEVIPSYPQGWDVNCTGTFNVFEYSVKNKVKKVIYASSICAVGFITWNTPNHSIIYFPVDEKHPCRPENIYGASKLLAEKLAYMYSRRSNTSFIGFRIATVWFDGPNGGPDEDTKTLIDDFVKDPANILNRSFPYPNVTVHALKDLSWQYVGVWDVAEAFKLAIENANTKFDIYNLGAEDSCSDWDSLKIAQYFYPGVSIRNPTIFLLDRKRTLWDISKAKRKLGFKPKFRWTEYVK